MSDTSMPSATPWDRRPDEPDRWFQRFEAFRLLGPIRSKLAVYKADRREREKAGLGGKRQEKAGKGGVPRRVPSTWDRAAARWEWRAG